MDTNTPITPTRRSLFAQIDEARLVARGRHLRSVEIRHMFYKSLAWIRNHLGHDRTERQDPANCC